jgi:hypothetical protein
MLSESSGCQLLNDSYMLDRLAALPASVSHHIHRPADLLKLSIVTLNHPFQSALIALD